MSELHYLDVPGIIWQRIEFVSRWDKPNIKGIAVAVRHENESDYFPYKDIVTIGVSFWNPADEYDLEKGKHLAYLRAMKALQGETTYLHNLYDSPDEKMYAIDKFVHRCAKYFRDCVIIYPKLAESKKFL